MSNSTGDKPFGPSKIPPRRPDTGCEGGPALPSKEADAPLSLEDGLFYVIDYESSSIEGVGKFAPMPQKIEPPQKDPLRDLFYSMREIGRTYRTSYFTSRFFDRRAQRENALIFYKQAVFMKDFTDDYPESTPFQEYFPYYQLMSYEQLRTYFTWRTRVRQGTVTVASLSYVFLYLYELIHNIGGDSHLDGLNKIMAFWAAYRGHDSSIDKYVLRWLRDYHIYYPLPHTFVWFIGEHNLTGHFPKEVEMEDDFALYQSVSRYKITNSPFFTGERAPLVTGCVCFVIEQLRQQFSALGMSLEQCIFQPPKKLTPWQPFKDALFYPWLNQPDRQVILNQNEVYRCNQNHWTMTTARTSENGRQLAGYILKQTESVLRRAAGYQHKLTANLESVNHEALDVLNRAGLSLGTLVEQATREFYRQATKTVVTVDPGALSRIRQEALVIQEKLIVEEQQGAMPAAPKTPAIPPAPVSPTVITPLPAQQSVPAPLPSPWQAFKESLSPVEAGALRTLLAGEGNIRAFADSHGEMVEVLMDGINEKAADTLGDSLMDEDFTLYEDYMDQVRKLVE